ncbi:hypothetical protein C8J27_106206 [Rhodobacter aestuarii]|uniref:Uncharacterized protein n=1 Tax=Rhodobacter aestuarii TaxID=453582 RepID=A0A1N7M9G6_9RHOB|nr:hypothetical protein [Rhodobacter aestuarii]PTV94937.1 hypothetical protein C8J27_106206 [Rhodobacter aestuarii]SIS82734.1 hypothetical protein SAMN05421580_105206 [Rhodobacter aestuarii]
MIYLTFADEAEALAALYETDGETPRYPGLEILNPCPMPVSEATGAVDAEGAAISAAVPGYHVNCVCPLGTCSPELDPWRVYPVTPFAVLAT